MPLALRVWAVSLLAACLHLLAEGSRPAVIGVSADNITFDFIYFNMLTHLIYVKRGFVHLADVRCI